MVARFFITFILLFCWSLIASDKHNPVVLVISVLDDRSFTQEDVDDIRSYVKELLPNHKFLNASVNTNEKQTSYLKFVSDLETYIRQSLLPNDYITHLMILDHGATKVINSRESTIFSVLGHFNDREVSPLLSKVLSPLKGRLSDDAIIFMESCQSFCGEIQSVKARAEILMRYLEVKNGTVFGAYTDMISPVQIEKNQVRNFTKGFRDLKVTLIAGILSALTISSQAVADKGYIEALPYGIAVYISIPLLTVMLDRLLYQSNLGYLLSFKDSFVSRVWRLNPYKNKRQIFLNLEPVRVKSEVKLCRKLFS